MGLNEAYLVPCVCGDHLMWTNCSQGNAKGMEAGRRGEKGSMG